MRLPTTTITLIAIVSAQLGCEREGAPPPAASAPQEGPPRGTTAEASVDPGIGPMPPSWVEPRVAEAQQRMQASEAGKLVWKAIEAGGGLATWLSHGTLEFEFDYAPIGKPEQRRHTFQRVDLWRARARHQELGEGADAELAYDGERAWIAPGPHAFPSPARFWSTTPYYFLGMPFVAADPGTRYTSLEDAEYEGRPHHLVKLSYGEGVGDSPGDYYVLYLDAEQGTLSALRYIVAYPGFFPPGKHSPEKLMALSEITRAGDLRVAQRLDTYAWDADAGQRGERLTEVRASRIRFGQRYPDDLFEPPPGAVIEPPLTPAQPKP